MFALIAIIAGILAAGFVAGFAFRAALSARRHRSKWGAAPTFHSGQTCRRDDISSRGLGTLPKELRPRAREFDDPTALPDGRKLRTLREAGDYITELPGDIHTAAEGQAAMGALILVATLRSDNVRPDRRHAGRKPTRRTHVQS